jgi:ribokinase
MALDLLPHVDVFLPNEAEAHALTGEADVWKAARLLSAKGPLVAVKCGEKGAIAVRCEDSWQIKGSECQDTPLSVADTTGAGHNFDAGFLRAWLLGKSIDSALRLWTPLRVKQFAVRWRYPRATERGSRSRDC